MRILITAFGPFSTFKVNPSETTLIHLKNHLEDQFQGVEFSFNTIDVSFNDVDHYIDTLKNEFDLVIHLGVATNEPKMRFEFAARNVKFGRDVTGVEFAESKIDISGEDLDTSFPVQHLIEIMNEYSDYVQKSTDAGAYLCNYIYYKSLQKFKSDAPVLFVHVADTLNNINAPSEIHQAHLIKQTITKFINSTHQSQV